MLALVHKNLGLTPKMWVFSTLMETNTNKKHT